MAPSKRLLRMVLEESAKVEQALGFLLEMEIDDPRVDKWFGFAMESLDRLQRLMPEVRREIIEEDPDGGIGAL